MCFVKHNQHLHWKCFYVNGCDIFKKCHHFYATSVFAINIKESLTCLWPMASCFSLTAFGPEKLDLAPGMSPSLASCSGLVHTCINCARASAVYVENS